MRVFVGKSSLILIVLAIPLVGCGRTSKQDSASPKQITQKEMPPTPDPVTDGTAATGTEITLHVEGMV